MQSTPEHPKRQLGDFGTNRQHLPATFLVGSTWRTNLGTDCTIPQYTRKSLQEPNRLRLRITETGTCMRGKVFPIR